MPGVRLAVLVFCCLSIGAFALPPNLTVEAIGPGGAVVHFDPGSTSGEDHNGRPTTTVTCSPSSGSLFPLGVTTVGCSSGSFTITIVDTTPPLLTIPESLNVQGSSSGATATWNAVAVDSVDGYRTVTCTPPSGSHFSVGTSAVQCSASDSRNNTASGSFTVVVNGPSNPPPAFNDVTKEATGPDGAIVIYNITGGDEDENGRPIEEASCSPASGSRFALGTHTVQCANGGFKVHVVDTTGPALTLPRDFTAPATSASGANVTFNASAHDLVDGATSVTCTPSSGGLFPIGATHVQCTSSDSRNNGSSDSFTVTVVAQQPPPDPPGDLVVEATGPDGAVVSFNFPGPGGDDENGRPTQTASCSPASGSTFPIGETTVQCNIGSFNVTVRDTTAPALALPDNLVSQNAVVTFTASATDLVDGSVGVTCAPPSGSTFAEGSTTVVCTTSDSRGNTATGSFQVTVDPTPPPVDTEAPVVISINASPNVLQPPNGKLVAVELDVKVIDNLDTSPYVGIYDVTANEAIDASDWNVTGPTTLELRAKRNGQESGRVYTVHVEAIDDAGNRSTGSVTVTVPHDNGNATQAPATSGKRRAAGR